MPSAAIARVLASLHATPESPTQIGSSFILRGLIPAAGIHELRQHLPGLTSGEGFVESQFDSYRPVLGPAPRRLSPDRRVGHLRCAAAEEEDPGEAGRLEAALGLRSSTDCDDAQLAGAVVRDEEDRAAAFVGGVVAHDAAGQVEREQVAVEVDRAPAATARRARTRRVGAVADRRCCRVKTLL